jgi:hypothetical protein
MRHIPLASCKAFLLTFFDANPRSSKGYLLKLYLPLLFKACFPPLLGGFGALVALGWSDGFRAFCGL